MHTFRFSPVLRYALIVTTVSSITALSGCTSSSNKHSAPSISNALSQVSGQNGQECIRVSNIRGYAVNNDNVIAIDATNKYYLATTLYTCHDISTAPRALFDSRFSEACGGSAYIITRDARCPIQKIYEFENRRAAFEVLDQAKEVVKAAKQARDTGTNAQP